MNKSEVKKCLMAVLAVACMVLLGVFKTQNDGDRSFQRLELQQGQSVDCIVDIGKMGMLKYWLEPNIMTVGLRCHTTDAVIGLRCEVEGIRAIVSQAGKKGRWKSLQADDILVQRGKNILPLNLELSVAADNINRKNVQNGKVKLWSKDELYAVINLQIINSRYQ